MNLLMQLEEIIEQAKQGSEQAYNALVGEWYKRIYNFALNYFADDYMAGEVTQKTFIAVYKNLDKLSDVNKFRSWLYRIAANFCNEEQRKQQRRWFVPLPGSAGFSQKEWKKIDRPTTDLHLNPESQLKRADLSAVIQKALGQLKEEQRVVILMKEYEGLKFTEIAEALQISENTAKSRLYYGLKHLKEIFEKWNINKENFLYEL